jgi:YfiH family protein
MTATLSRRIAAAGLDWIVPAWEAPPQVAALSTSRNGGVSGGACASLDLGAAHLADDSSRAGILENRARVAAFLPSAPVWLSQVHGRDVASVDAARIAAMRENPPVADAAVTAMPGVVLAVRTADCLPVLLADRAGTVIGAAHAGWRGLAAGVLEATLAAMCVPGREIVAWLGPAIGPQSFEVGRDVFEAFCTGDSGARACFAEMRDEKWLADLYGLARRRLKQAGVVTIGGGEYCTLTQGNRFFSYRRDRSAGRMASMLWLDPR